MLEKATFAAGCFWGVQDAFDKLPGVEYTEVGYTGGASKDPTYDQVSMGNTGHAEAVQLEYDPDKISYEELLDAFWKMHDPTQLNRQGPDIGSNYRSAIFYHTDEQRDLAEQSRDALEKSGKSGRHVVTEIKPAEEFWRAEEYHQKYFEKHGGDSCHI